MLAKDGFAAQDPRETVQVGETEPFHCHEHVQVTELPAEGNEGVTEGVPLPQNASHQKPEAAYG